jgi:hypothetical protein
MRRVESSSARHSCGLATLEKVNIRFYRSRKKE